MVDEIDLTAVPDNLDIELLSLHRLLTQHNTSIVRARRLHDDVHQLQNDIPHMRTLLNGKTSSHDGLQVEFRTNI